MSRKKGNTPQRSVRMPMRDVNMVIGPVTNALLGLTMGTATEEHYNHIAGAFIVAQQIGETVPRHRHVVQELKPSIDALNDVFARHKEGGNRAALWSATIAEVEKIEIGVEIYRALLIATPRTFLGKSIDKARQIIAGATNFYDDTPAEAPAA